MKTAVFQAIIKFLRVDIGTESLKGRVHCFSMQVVMNKCFLLNPEKNLTQIRLVVYEKTQKRTFKSEKCRHRAKG